MGATANIAMAVVGGLSQVAGSLLAPKPPEPPKPIPMPDPLAQQEALKKSLLEQTARRGRLASILTDQSGTGKLGG